METEPTAEKRQHQAFGYLRDRARNAHIAGDGLTVGVLCHTGLDNIRKLAKEGKLLLPFSEIIWMPIFALYWLVIPSERYAIQEIFQKLQRTTDEDRLLGQWIDRYLILVEQPLAGDAQATPALKDFSWPACFAERNPEIETIVVHMVELLWFHGPNAENWKQLIDSWLQVAPSWTRDIFLDLKSRLAFQARLTCPDKSQDLIAESRVRDLRQHYDISELWLHHLHGRSAKVVEVAKSLTPSLSADSHRWRVLHDFFHFNSLFQPDAESQYVHLARRRRLSVETPLLIFNDKREERLTETLGELFRSRSKSKASTRWEIYLLAQLHELAALRVWDYGMWLEATRAQANACLEMAEWTDAHQELVANGLVLAVRSLCAKSPEKDPITRRSIDTLELAPANVISSLSDGMLATYPRQKHGALEILEDVADLLPEQDWPAWALWVRSYTQESSENRAGGKSVGPAKHWIHVLPLVSRESMIWSILQPEALGMAGSSYCWSGRDGDFLQRWLLFGPTDLAKAVAETMTNHEETHSGFCFDRANLLIEFEEWNVDLKGFYTKRLLPTAHSTSEALILARHLGESDVPSRETTLREGVLQAIKTGMSQAIFDPAVNKFHSPPVITIDLVEQWLPEDQAILLQLIETINKPDVYADYLPWLLSIIQMFVANGPIVFANIVQPHVREWSRNPPSGREMSGAFSGPLSVVQFQNGEVGDIELMLGWLAFQLPEKLGVASHGVVLEWARQMLLKGQSKPLDMVIYASAVIALQMPATTSVEPLALMETAILSLSGRVNFEKNASTCLAGALRKISYLIGSELFEPSSTLESPSSVESFVAVLSRFVSSFAKSPSAALRAAVAALVWQLNSRNREEPWVIDNLRMLQQDNRARVRFEAKGGWKVARTRISKT